MTIRTEIVHYIDTLLDVNAFHDYAPNGLQIAGLAEVSSIHTAVSASRDTLKSALEHNASLLIVHHGYFWKGEPQVLTGWRRARIALCVESGLNILAYHLPLDYHPELGNNAQLARHMGWKVDGRLSSQAGKDFGMIGHLSHAMQPEELASHLQHMLGQQPIGVYDVRKPIKRIAWCTGAAYDDIEYAIEAGVDAFITGEIAERTYHIAKEAGIAFFAAGHYATERYGVQALGKHVAEKFGLQHQFVDIHCPV